MALREAINQLDELGIEWEVNCPNVIKGDGCPEEFQEIEDWTDKCPLCWIEYGGIK